PFTYILRKEHSVARNALKLVHTRSEYMEFIDDIEENSIDDYATIKSYYIQNSEHMLQKSKPRTIEYNQ
ncbi:MAG: MlaA lipoprotein, partial [Pseudomonadota bacterium]